jgi:hypothetical protein
LLRGLASYEHQYKCDRGLGRRHAHEAVGVVASSRRVGCRAAGRGAGSNGDLVVALAWMGVACILNARRCGRTHCRFTGPYYLVMIVPVFALGLCVVPAGLSGWLVLGAFIILGSKALWWATERAWGKFS